jgi:hypothetical protein
MLSNTTLYPRQYGNLSRISVLDMVFLSTATTKADLDNMMSLKAFYSEKKREISSQDHQSLELTTRLLFQSPLTIAN